MKDEILAKIYANEQYLEYLRKNPKWYLYLDQDPSNYKLFEKNAKSELKLTMNDKLERFRKQVTFAGAVMKYFSK